MSGGRRDKQIAATFAWTAFAVMVLAVLANVALLAQPTERGRSVPAQADVELKPAASAPRELRAEAFRIELANVTEADGVVRGEIVTDIPLPVEVMVLVSLHGQADDDVFVGNDARVTLRSSPQQFAISIRDGGGARTVDASNALPRGEYDVEVAFYPRWGAQNGNVAARSIREEIRAVQRISIRGSGQGAAAANARNEAQRWVAMHLDLGTPWDLRAAERQLGPGERFRISGEMNPDVIVGYYFERADTTVFVNVVRNEIAMWRYGRHQAM